MTLRDLLSICAADHEAQPASASALWVFDDAGAGAHAAVPGPGGTDDDALAGWGRTLYQAATHLAEHTPFIPIALVLLVPDPECPYLDGAAVGADPARLLLTPRPAHPIGLRTPANESIAARLLEVARRTATARFN